MLALAPAEKVVLLSPLLSPAAAAERCGVSIPTVYRWLDDGLPSYKLGRSRRIPEDGLQTFLDRYRVTAPALANGVTLSQEKP